MPNQQQETSTTLAHKEVIASQDRQKCFGFRVASFRSIFARDKKHESRNSQLRSPEQQIRVYLGLQRRTNTAEMFMSYAG
jgi:hypothetical protein